MISRARFLIVMMSLSLAGGWALADPASAPQLSADIVSRDGAGTAAGDGGRLYLAGRKVRIETPELADGFFLIGTDLGPALFVRPAQRIFMDARQSSRLTQIFVPVEPEDPCPQWKAAAKAAGLGDADGDWRCERIDTPTIAGRTAIEYRVEVAGQPADDRWVDPDLGLTIKYQASDGSTLALEHIRREAQPADLFTLPSDYRKFDPQALIERIKKSDVWVEQPK